MVYLLQSPTDPAIVATIGQLTGGDLPPSLQRLRFDEYVAKGYRIIDPSRSSGYWALIPERNGPVPITERTALGAQYFPTWIVYIGEEREVWDVLVR